MWPAFFQTFYRWRDRGEGRLNGLLSTEELGTEFSVRYTRLQGLLVDQKSRLWFSGKWEGAVEVRMGSQSLLPTFYERGTIIDLIFIVIL